MSIASVKARIAAATEGPWETTPGAEGRTDIYAHGGPVAMDCDDLFVTDADFIAHARTDLELALAVVEAAWAVVVATGCTSGCRPAYPCPRCRLETAYDAFEAAP